MESTRLITYGQTDRGLVRSANEDAFVCADLSTSERLRGATAAWTTSPKGVLLAVSDGMGGARAGEVASALSVEGLLEGMMETSRERVPDSTSLRRVVERSSRRVFDEGQRSDRRGMGATLTAVLVSGDAARIAQIGDSRAYLLRRGRIGQVTHDQSYVQMLVDAGVLTPEQASLSPKRNVILQVMGQEAVDVALGTILLQRGDRLLLCSDGLTNVLDDETIRALAQPPSDLASACDDLVACTKERGAPDNVTVVLAEVA
jgi:serine/threonine protein phosphatase PrpC